MTTAMDAYIENPYAVFAAARTQHPVVWQELLGIPIWLVTGYREVDAILKDSRFVREYRRLVPPEHQPVFSERIAPAMKLMNDMMLFKDAPDHTRLRNLVNKAFTPRMVEKLRPAIGAIADQLLDDMRGRRKHELIRDFAYLLPVFVIAELLGVPREDRGFFRRWSDAFVRFIDFNPTMEELESLSGDIAESKRYFEELIAVRRTAPQDDLISKLIASEESGDQLSTDEMVATCLLLMIAGHETTANLITNGYKLLLDHPEMYELLRADRSLAPAAVEEILRYEPPVLMTSRLASGTIEFAGATFQKAQGIMLALAGANRDPSVVSRPDEFDIARKDCKHLSFAAGPHYCLGAPLARLEGCIALDKLVARARQPELAAEPQWRKNIIFRGYEALHFKAEIL
ncbi:cytochrome P450 [Paenibacillus thermotolerans]|uniref:cytochrome P450 n=1 Tax=Paenibacillus thermotolerans TaxID=3027807 RepID=UPI002368E28A|nr:MULTISPECIES: cytochrome P450 [unclassified Paenibacillus]